MQKDVIYIDVEDDITAIIGKVKASKQKIIALVPPKRVGVLQSAVNLRLVNRAAEHAHKRLVIITNNEALMGLAAAAAIPVAKNLQSKPELAEIPALAVDDDNDVIDGSELPVGEHAATANTKAESKSIDKAVDDMKAKESTAIGSSAVGAAALLKKKPNIKVPNFGDTRKKLAIIIGGVVLFVIFIIWAFFFAPNARIIISARTTTSGLSATVKMGDSQNTDSLAKTLKTTTKQLKKDVSVEITPTGKKDLGTKASGTVTFTQCSDNDITIPAGTAVSAGGMNFMTANKVTVEPSSTRRGSCQADYPASVTVNAQNNGDQYNIGPQSYQVAGMSNVKASGSQMAGGTSKMATVATQSDIQAAIDKATQANNADAAKKSLKEQLGDAIVIDQSFKADTSGVKPNVQPDQDFGDTKPAVAGAASYTMMGIAKSELDKYLTTYFEREIDGTANQKVYDNGRSKVAFSNVIIGEDGSATAVISTNGKLGPKIDDAAIREFAKDKEYGAIQSHIESVNGVDSVDIKFSPFWVSKAPNDINKIKVEFDLNDK